MPSLETPPKSAPPNQPVKVRTGRYGELEEHELIHLLDSLDDERSKARFRESIYISVIIYLAILWFLFYGPRVLFHQPRLISPAQVLKDREQQLTRLDDPTNLPRTSAPKSPPPRPVVDQKMLKQLQAMRKAAPPAPAAPPKPTPTPPVTQPAPPQQATPLPPAPQPQPTQQPAQQALVEAPKPVPTRPNFGNPNQTAGDAIRQAAQGAARDHGASDSGGQTSGRGGMGTGAEILSDTQGVDFGPYIRRILQDIKRNWYPLIPEEARPPLNKQGETLIRFTIMPDGRIAAMNLDGSSQDQSIDRACWGAITGEGQFPPLPASFHGPNLELRIDFLTNKPLP